MVIALVSVLKVLSNTGFHSCLYGYNVLVLAIHFGRLTTILCEQEKYPLEKVRPF